MNIISKKRNVNKTTNNHEYQPLPVYERNRKECEAKEAENISEFEQKTIKEMKPILKKHNLKVSGVKKELIVRMKEYNKWVHFNINNNVE